MEMAIGLRNSPTPFVSKINPNTKRSSGSSSLSMLNNRFFQPILSCSSLIYKTPLKSHSRNSIKFRVSDAMNQQQAVVDSVKGLNESATNNGLEVVKLKGTMAAAASSSSSSSSTNLHFYLISEDIDDNAYRLYLFSLYQPSIDDENISTPVLSPVFEFTENYNMRAGMGFFSVGSKIFMFGGRDTSGDDPFKDKRCRNVFVYDTITGDITSCAPMKKGKYSPMIIGPTYDGKFYVIYKSVGFGIESYDPVTDEWRDISPPDVVSFNDMSCDALHVTCSAMVNNNTIFIMTDKADLFSCDLRTSTYWEWHGYTEMLPTQSGRPFDIGGDVLAGDYLFALDQELDLYAFHFDPLEYRRTGEPSTVSIVENLPSVDVDEDGSPPSFVSHIGDMRFCVLRTNYETDMETDTDRTRVTVDVFRAEQLANSAGHFSAVDLHNKSFILDDGRCNQIIRAFLPMY